MTDLPLVSVLLTCYNHLPYIGECVEGVLAQTYPNLQIIAIDDGSTDGTREWLKENESRIATRCPIKIIFSEQNLGTYGALNAAIEASSGELLAVLNDDDFWLPEKIASQVELLRNDARIGLTHTDGEFVDQQSAVIKGSPLGFAYPRTATGDMFPALIEFNKIIASSTLFRRECLAKVGPFDPEFYGCGDWHMWVRIAEFWHVGFVHRSLTRYRVHDLNACHNSDRMIEDEWRIRTWLRGRTRELLQSDRSSNELRRALAHNLACIGTESAWRGNRGAALVAYLDSLRLLPTRFKSLLRIGSLLLPAKLLRKLR